MWLKLQRRRAFERLVAYLEKHRSVQGLKRFGSDEARFETRHGPGSIRLASATDGDIGGLRVLQIEVLCGRQWSPVHLHSSGVLPSMVLPQKDIQVGDARFDADWTIRSSDPRAARLALTPAVRDLVQKLKLRELRLSGRRITVTRQDGAPPVALIAGALKLAELLSEGGWDRVAEKLGLTQDDEGTLTGLVRGVPLTAMLDGEDTVVSARVTGHGVRAVHKDLGGGVSIGDPVLDGLVSLRGDPEHLRQVLDPDTAGALLAVVHAYAGSEVGPAGVRLVFPGMAIDELEELVERVVTLAESLSA